MLKSVKISLRQKVTLIICGVFLSLVLLETGMRITGFLLSSLQERRNIIAIKHKGTYRIMCLGESTTNGGLGNGSYPYQLQEILNKRNIGIRFSVINKGLPGMKTSDILDQLEASLDKYNPDLVITMMGINDYGGHIPYQDKGLKRSQYFWEYLKIYKLYKFILLHAENKRRETKLAIKGPFPQRVRIWGEEDLKRKIGLDPQKEQEYVGLARLYETQGRYYEAEEELKKAVAINPKNNQSYFELGYVYLFQDKNDRAEECFLKAIELDSSDSWPYLRLGEIYEMKKDIRQAQRYYEKSLELDPGNMPARLELAWFYKNQGKFSQAEELLQKAIEVSPEDERQYGAMEILYRETGNLKLSREYGKKAEEIIRRSYRPATVKNYLRLKRILDRKGVKYMCMQYPMRSIGPLRRIFNAESGVIFVDNEGVFRKAVEKEGYNQYFCDMFSGDFGHCTAKGNRLIAKNVARVILKEYFDK